MPSALAGYLTGYRGLPREAYTLDLRQFHQLVPHLVPSPVLGGVRRADIETFARELEDHRRACHRHSAPVHDRRVLQARSRRGILDHSPAVHVRRPRVD
jgi:hypothetical protein